MIFSSGFESCRAQFFWEIFKNFLDFVVQVVDARRPLLYRCADVEKYVKEVALRQGEEKGLVLKLPKSPDISLFFEIYFELEL